MRRQALLGLAFVMVCGIGTWAWAQAQPQPGVAIPIILDKPIESSDKPIVISDKPIMIQGKDDFAITLEKTVVRQLGGRQFVVGVELKTDPYLLTKQRFKGATVWIPIDTVTMFAELDPVKAQK